ncbi:MAG: outer membrane lipoprotein chaperone LolA [Methylotenera sp.]|uniref:outer membrane lipoprotein chaperone LolA n=1 Tax=Methylotenera sp. TaxID=2051956 RepID=UPI002486DE6A|nr:outer membrane lipoprotein chaperone LolA [Methylotenera sp.]MDI1309611.1 outer membrane lipoprotein chaperone LolA [Methylotenera sp.]
MSQLKAAVLSCLLMLPFAAQADGVSSLKKFYENTHAVKADFHQIVTDKQGQKIQEVFGEMQLKRPNKFKWNYHKPYEQQIISDGKQVWLYDTELAQVSVRELSKALGSSPAALLAGGDSLDKNFNLVNAFRKDGLDWVSTNPKDSDTGFNQILLAFKNDVLQEMDMIDSFGHQTKILFSNVVHNPVIDPKTFLFKAPQGVDVVGE